MADWATNVVKLIEANKKWLESVKANHNNEDFYCPHILQIAAILEELGCWGLSSVERERLASNEKVGGSIPSALANVLEKENVPERSG